jgi:hypothetical protein
MQHASAPQSKRGFDSLHPLFYLLKQGYNQPQEAQSQNVKSDIVKADSLDSISNVISPVLGKAEARFGSDWVWLENGKTSSEPPHHFRFEPPSRLRSMTTQN